VGGAREEYNDESNYETVEQNYEIIRHTIHNNAF